MNVAIKLPCAHQPETKVRIVIGNQILNNCFIAAVKFTETGKVYYDIRVEDEENDITTWLHKIDSVFIQSDGEAE